MQVGHAGDHGAGCTGRVARVAAGGGADKAPARVPAQQHVTGPAAGQQGMFGEQGARVAGGQVRHFGPR
ncbi:hypothetical protein ALISP_3708 [Alicycliphilus sp. B1]|nr:hypothetical protein ALISP_3708 [Alicycliphilus sp. B1]